MLNDYRDDNAPFQIPGFTNIIEPIKREIEEARKSGWPIIYLCDCHEKDDREFKLFPPHAVRGSSGASIVDELKPEGTDILVRKNTFSGFYNTELDEMLKKLSISKIVITGIITNISVICTAVDALMRDYEVDVVKDAVRGLDDRSHDFAIDQMENVFNIGVN
ncbi:cysteine hydrolase family protein, partial [Actinomycetota bacterium]